MSSSSSDTDEEEKQRLKESVLGFSMDTTEASKENASKKLKSMRSTDDDTRESVLNTTPEFRSFVGKKLDSYLGSVLEDIGIETDNPAKVNACGDDDDNSGIKLLAKSSVVLLDKESPIHQEKVLKKKPKRTYYSSSSDDDNEMERFRSAAVSFDSIAQQSAIAEHRNGANGALKEKDENSKKKKKKAKKAKNCEELDNN